MNRVTSGACVAPASRLALEKPKEITDEVLDQQFSELPSLCSRNRGLPVTDGNGRKVDWDANLISLQYGGRHIFDVVASCAPTQNSFDYFWDLIRQNPTYLINLASAPGAYYLSATSFINAIECPLRGIEVSRASEAISPSSKITACKKDVQFTTNPQLSERISVPAVEVLNWEGQKGLEPADLHFLVLTLQSICKDFSNPGVIHCHLGKGRTATLIIGMALKLLSDRNILTEDNLKDALKELITDGREARDKSFVESAHQYRSLYRYGQELGSGLLSKTL